MLSVNAEGTEAQLVLNYYSGLNKSLSKGTEVSNIT